VLQGVTTYSCTTSSPTLATRPRTTSSMPPPARSFKPQSLAGVKDKTSNDLLPAQTSADQGSLKSEDPNTPALLPGPGPN